MNNKVLLLFVVGRVLEIERSLQPFPFNLLSYAVGWEGDIDRSTLQITFTNGMIDEVCSSHGIIELGDCA